ncbi:MAG: ATP-binding protein [Syntrophales bacterium]|nr:ATP-binding protein [Syntrophales bacterium]
MNTTYKKSLAVEGGNFDNAGMASIEIKKILKDLNIHDDILRKTAIAVYESELNIISYARNGRINLIVDDNEISIDVQDEGPGIEDIELAMQPGYSTATEHIRQMGFGAGMGLYNIKSCSDRFEISSTVNVGTHLKIIINRGNNL